MMQHLSQLSISPTFMKRKLWRPSTSTRNANNNNDVPAVSEPAMSSQEELIDVVEPDCECNQTSHGQKTRLRRHHFKRLASRTKETKDGSDMTIQSAPISSRKPHSISGPMRRNFSSPITLPPPSSPPFSSSNQRRVPRCVSLATPTSSPRIARRSASLSGNNSKRKIIRTSHDGTTPRIMSKNPNNFPNQTLMSPRPPSSISSSLPPPPKSPLLSFSVQRKASKSPRPRKIQVFEETMQEQTHDGCEVFVTTTKTVQPDGRTITERHKKILRPPNDVVASPTLEAEEATTNYQGDTSSHHHPKSPTTQKTPNPSSPKQSSKRDGTKKQKMKKKKKIPPKPKKTEQIQVQD